MLNVGVIGLGNGGNQQALLAKRRWAIDSMAINCSERDLSTLGNEIPTYVIGDARGAGKNRDEAKRSLKESIQSVLQKKEFVSFCEDKDVVFINSTTGGGTGSGIAPLFCEICSKVFPDQLFILVATIPTLNEGMSTQLNTIEYLKELYNTLNNVTYMIYDNDKLAELPSHIMMQKINESVVDDINALRCYFNATTQYSSIDEKDMMTILATPGRIFVSRLEKINEKDTDTISIEDMIVKNIKTNAHAEIQRDGAVNRTGIIVNVSTVMSETLNTHVPAVQNLVGSPVEEFEHITINTDRKMDNNVIFIMSGLSKIADRILKINERIAEIERLQDIESDDYDVLDNTEVSKLNSKRLYRTPAENADKVDLGSIFDKFK